MTTQFMNIVPSDSDTYSSDACGAGDTDAETLLVTVASSLFDLHEPTDVGNNIELKYFCADCGLNFNQLEELSDHQTKVHTEDCEDPALMMDKCDAMFQCDVCLKVFSEAKILRRHLKIHSPHKPHVCNICDMSFAESSNLTKHKKKHTGELRNIVGKPNLCSVCGKYLVYD